MRRNHIDRKRNRRDAYAEVLKHCAEFFEHMEYDSTYDEQVKRILAPVLKRIQDGEFCPNRRAAMDELMGAAQMHYIMIID